MEYNNFYTQEVERRRENWLFYVSFRAAEDPFI